MISYAYKGCNMEFKLRKLKVTDAKDFAESANDEEIAKWLRNGFPYPYHEEDAVYFLKSVEENPERNRYLFGIEICGRIAGAVSVFPGENVYEKNGELGYWLRRNDQGKGIMTAAVRQTIEKVFRETSLARIYAEPFADNLRSRKVLEYNGFRLEGILSHNVFKRGEFHDSAIYALLRSEFSQNLHTTESVG